MSTGTKVVPAQGDKVHRMSNDPVKDAEGNVLPNTSGNIVNFKVEYPKDYKAEKFMKEGEVHKLHIIHAQTLEDKGTGKIQKNEK